MCPQEAAERYEKVLGAEGMGFLGDTAETFELSKPINSEDQSKHLHDKWSVMLALRWESKSKGEGKQQGPVVFPAIREQKKRKLCFVGLEQDQRKIYETCTRAFNGTYLHKNHSTAGGDLCKSFVLVRHPKKGDPGE
jgi:hypothetical protein